MTDPYLEKFAPTSAERIARTCRELVRLTLDEYRAMRRDPRDFVSGVDHEVAARGWAEVTAQTDGDVVVRKIDPAAEVAVDLAERRH